MSDVGSVASVVVTGSLGVEVEIGGALSGVGSAAAPGVASGCGTGAPSGSTLGDGSDTAGDESTGAA
jgi:hypothetical protein